MNLGKPSFLHEDQSVPVSGSAHIFKNLILKKYFMPARKFDSLSLSAHRHGFSFFIDPEWKSPLAISGKVTHTVVVFLWQKDGNWFNVREFQLPLSNWCLDISSVFKMMAGEEKKTDSNLSPAPRSVAKGQILTILVHFHNTQRSI